MFDQRSPSYTHISKRQRHLHVCQRDSFKGRLWRVHQDWDQQENEGYDDTDYSYLTMF